MWARVCLARGNPQEAKRALEILDQLAARGVETPLALNDMGVAHFQLADYEAAIGYFSKALDKSPGYGEALFNKALAEERDRRFQDAKRDWRLFIDLPTDESWKAEAKKHLESLQ